MPQPSDQGSVLGLIPARGGSKSIPLKNLAEVGGAPMLSYVLVAAARCRAVLDYVICSTDHDEIARVSLDFGATVDRRPEELCGDDVKVADVIRDLLRRFDCYGPAVPEIVVLLQPTSPFVLPEHIERLVALMRRHPEARSAQTVTPIEHNYHAYNQRMVEGETVKFHFAELRARAYNKQRKPKLFRFGNLLATRSAALLDGEDCFAEPSVCFEVPRDYSLDVDGPDDLGLADFLVSSGRIDLGAGPLAATGSAKEG